jgi:gamma-polyglutamate biosynthesis protein CapA
MARIRHNFFLLIIILILLSAGFFSYAYCLKKVNKPETKKQNTQIAVTKDQVSLNEKKSIKILFLGDMMFDRYIREIGQKKGYQYFFEKIRDQLKDVDLAIANLEGPITDNPSVSLRTAVEEKGHFIFTFDKSICNTLASNNIKLVNIGNNHILNFGQDGLTQTRANLTKANINYFGDFGENSAYTADINGYKIGFINYNQFSPGSFLRTLENIENLDKQSDMLILYTHWGVEYQTHSTESIRELGHKFIDSGADLVIGSHPHVVEEKEEYKGHWIYYSLGNFVFDQYFSKNTKKGLAVEMNISPEKIIEFQDVPLILDNNGQTKVNTL